MTGARGLIGRYIVEGLIAAGWKVRILSRQISEAAVDSPVSVILGDINDLSALRELLEGASAVFHCAAELHDESLMQTVNVKGTETLLSVARASAAQYFCHLSSAGVVGPVSFSEVDEETPCHPNNLYEKTKFEAEQMVVHADLHMNVCILRPTNVFDAQNPGILMLPMHHSFMDRLSLLLKGNEGTHLVHAKDVASAALYFVDKTLQGPQLFLVSCDDDQKNSVAGMYKLIRSMCCGDEKFRTFSFPNNIPYLLRRFFRGKSLHGRVRFSEKKLRSTGFVFPLGFQEGLVDVCRARKRMKA